MSTLRKVALIIIAVSVMANIAPMSAGARVLTGQILLIAFIDEMVLEWRGQRVQPVSDEAVRNE